MNTKPQGFNDFTLHLTTCALTDLYHESRNTSVALGSLLRRKLSAFVSDSRPRFVAHDGKSPNKAFAFSVKPSDYVTAVRKVRDMGLPERALGMVLALYVEKA